MNTIENKKAELAENARLIEQILTDMCNLSENFINENADDTYTNTRRNKDFKHNLRQLFEDFNHNMGRHNFVLNEIVMLEAAEKKDAKRFEESKSCDHGFEEYGFRDSGKVSSKLANGRRRFGNS